MFDTFAGIARPAALARGAGTALLGLAVLVAPALAQVSDEDRTRQELATELQEVQIRLDQIEQQALQDPELQEKRAELQERVAQAIRRADPDAEEKMERLEAVQDELHQAQEAGDGEQVQALVTELQEIQDSLEQTRARVMQDRRVVRRMQSFREDLLKEMQEIDPETPRLLERMEELQDELQIGTR